LKPNDKDGLAMLLENKVAVIYGAGGSIGGAVARAFAREGARVWTSRGNVAAFVASDLACTMTAADVNISSGAILD
jgi:3-oxoacyl-[acyl-carrier protein] reductase